MLGIASTDSHNLDIVDSGYVLALMPEKTSAALKKSLESGQFFAASKYIGNYDELVQLYEEVCVIKSLEASRVAGKLSEAIENIAAQIENGKQKDQYKVEDGTVAPKVTNIIVDNTADTITVTAENALTVHWIADGKVIHVGSRIDLNDHSDEIGSYVRAEVFGAGGILYVEPFLLSYDGAPAPEDEGHFYDFGTIASLICDTPVRILEIILPLGLIFKLAGK